MPRLRVFGSSRVTPAEVGFTLPAGHQPALSPEQAERVQRHFTRQPVISIVVPVYKVPPQWLDRCIQSVVVQHYPHWELILVDDGSQMPELTRLMLDWSRRDERIRLHTLPANGGICSATNVAFQLATGEFIGLLDHDDELTPDALTWVAAMHNRHPDAQWFYSDEDKINVDNVCSDPFYKPDFSPAYLLSVMYTCHFSVYARSLLQRAGGVRVGLDGSQDHDLALRLSELVARHHVIHIPRVLYHWRILPTSTASNVHVKPYTINAGLRAVREALDRRGVQAEVSSHPICPTLYQIRFLPRRQPKTTIIIPTRNHVDLVRNCVTSIRQHTRYANYQIVVVDNRSDQPELAEYLAAEQQAGTLLARPFPQPFNHSEMNNAVARDAHDSEFLVLMNNDVEILSDDWLEQLVATTELDPRIAGVGALLLYPDRTMQHAGILMGVVGRAGHAHRFATEDSLGYGGQANLLREVSGCTAAMLLVRRSAFLEIGGFDALRYPTSYNDVDLWLRFQQAGYHCLYNPRVRAIHHESKSRGVSPYEDIYVRRLHTDWLPALNRDPYYNPNLTLSNEQYVGYRDYPVEQDFPHELGVPERAAAAA